MCSTQTRDSVAQLAGGEFEVGRPPGLRQGTSQRFQMVVPAQPQFAAAGRYVIQCSVDGEVLGHTAIEVMSATPEGDATANVALPSPQRYERAGVRSRMTIRGAGAVGSQVSTAPAPLHCYVWRSSPSESPGLGLNGSQECGSGPGVHIWRRRSIPAMRPSRSRRTPSSPLASAKKAPCSAVSSTTSVEPTTPGPR